MCLRHLSGFPPIASWGGARYVRREDDALYQGGGAQRVIAQERRRSGAGTSKPVPHAQNEPHCRDLLIDSRSPIGGLGIGEWDGANMGVTTGCTAGEQGQGGESMTWNDAASNPSIAQRVKSDLSLTWKAYTHTVASLILFQWTLEMHGVDILRRDYWGQDTGFGLDQGPAPVFEFDSKFKLADSSNSNGLNSMLVLCWDLDLWDPIYPRVAVTKKLHENLPLAHSDSTNSTPFSLCTTGRDRAASRSTGRAYCLLAEIDTQRTEVAALRATLAIEHSRGLEQRIRLLEERGESPQVTLRPHPLHHLISGESSNGDAWETRYGSKGGIGLPARLRKLGWFALAIGVMLTIISDFPDALIRGRPVVLQSKDCHAQWVSGKALELSAPLPGTVEGGIVLSDPRAG
ncbi:hypothetical protein B0H13DRAFT_1918567 [Mycena leptocephala]|nr:hypothetical protein B0H13DRAFT_1918567 [Mycena leptocephala]